MADMTDDTRPKWPHETAEELARWLVSNKVTKITHHWEMYDCDKSRDWIVLHSEKNGSRKVSTSFFYNNRDFAFQPDHAGLVAIKQQYPKDVRQTIEELDAWEKKNERDRAEYRRLKAKFETR